jgi:hypothetical protein
MSSLRDEAAPLCGWRLLRQSRPNYLLGAYLTAAAGRRSDLFVVEPAVSIDRQARSHSETRPTSVKTCVGLACTQLYG